MGVEKSTVRKLCPTFLGEKIIDGYLQYLIQYQPSQDGLP